MENKDEEICDSDVGDSDKDINTSFFPLQDNTMTATCPKSDASPPLSPSQVDTFLSEKNSCLESSNISGLGDNCLLYTSPSPRDMLRSRMPSSA